MGAAGCCPRSSGRRARPHGSEVAVRSSMPCSRPRLLACPPPGRGTTALRSAFSPRRRGFSNREGVSCRGAAASEPASRPGRRSARPPAARPAARPFSAPQPEQRNQSLAEAASSAARSPTGRRPPSRPFCPALLSSLHGWPHGKASIPTGNPEPCDSRSGCSVRLRGQALRSPARRRAASALGAAASRSRAGFAFPVTRAPAASSRLAMAARQR